MDTVEGTPLKALRGATSQEALAYAIGVSVRTIRNIEKGASPSLPVARSLARHFDLSTDALLAILEDAEAVA